MLALISLCINVVEMFLSGAARFVLSNQDPITEFQYQVISQTSFKTL